MSSPYLPPGCTRLPGEEPEEPLHWSLAEQVKARVIAEHSDWRERGNRSDYIASDCWKDADLDGISTGIIDIVGTDTGIVVTYGWYATFCAGSDAAADTAQDIIFGCGLSGSWDCDNDGDGPAWTVSGEDCFSLNIDDAEEVTPEIVATLAAEVWATFIRKRTPLEEEAESCHRMLNKNYLEASE